MPTETLLSEHEIRRRLSIIRASSKHDRYRGKAIGIKTIARRADLSRGYLYLLAYGQRPIGPESRVRLSAALADVSVSDFD